MILKKILKPLCLLTCFMCVTNVSASTMEERKAANHDYLANYTFNFKLNDINDYVDIFKSDMMPANYLKEFVLGDIVISDLRKNITMGQYDCSQIVCYQKGDQEQKWNDETHTYEMVAVDHDYCELMFNYSDGELDDDGFGGMIGINDNFTATGTFENISKDDAASKKAKAIAKEFSGNIRVADMDMINHIINYNSDGSTFFDANNSLKEFPSLKKLVETNPEFTYEVGFESSFKGDRFGVVPEGSIILKKDGIVYGIINNSYHADYRFFVPNDTKVADYASVLEKRIKDYIKDENVTVSVTENDENHISNDVWDVPAIFNLTKEEYYKAMGTTYAKEAAKLSAEERDGLEEEQGCVATYAYNLKINNKTYVISVTPVDKAYLSNFGNTTSEDIKTGIIIRTGSSNVPLDSTLNVKDYNLSADEIKVLEGLGYTGLDGYNFKLYSSILDKVISKFNNSSEILIPLGDNKVEDLQMVYISDDFKTTEKYDVKEVTYNGVKYMSFSTNHFSNYVLAKKSTTNPKTGDNITLSLIVGVISALGIGVTSYKLKKQN